MTNKASDSTSGAGMGQLSDDDVQWEISAASTNPAWLDMEYGRRIEALVRADASRLLAEREERIAKLKAALTALRRSHDADVDGHGLTVGQLLVINEALKD